MLPSRLARWLRSVAACLRAWSPLGGGWLLRRVLGLHRRFGLASLTVSCSCRLSSIAYTRISSSPRDPEHFLFLKGFLSFFRGDALNFVDGRTWNFSRSIFSR